MELQRRYFYGQMEVVVGISSKILFRNYVGT